VSCAESAASAESRVAACTETSAQPKGVGRGRRRKTGPSAAAARARRERLRSQTSRLGREQLLRRLELPVADGDAPTPLPSEF